MFPKMTDSEIQIWIQRATDGAVKLNHLRLKIIQLEKENRQLRRELERLKERLATATASALPCKVGTIRPKKP